MVLKYFKPTTPSRRNKVSLDNSGLWKGKPEKSLTEGMKSTGGRNNYGRMTVKGRGGGVKKLYRLVDFRRNIPGEYTVERIEYDPNRSANIMLVRDSEKKPFYFLHPTGVKVQEVVINSMDKIRVQPGNCMPLKHIPMNTLIHNVELKKFKGGQLARSAGTSCELMSKQDGYAQIKLRSGEIRLVHLECLATIGVVSNMDHQNIQLGSAGVNRRLGRRPITRGVAMNPVDHIMGGGEGKASGRANSPSKWGTSIKGVKTRRRSFTNNMIVKSRHKR